MSRASCVALVGLLIAGCGGKPPAPAAVAPTPAAPPPAAPPPAPVALTAAPISCADAGGLLARQFSAYDDAMIAKHETEIAKACTAGKWPQAVLDCLGGTIDGASACVEKLPHDQQVALVSSVTRAEPPKPPEPPPSEEEHYTSCVDAIGDATAFGAATATGDDGKFELDLRRRALVEACNESGWRETPKSCFAAAHDLQAVSTCMKKLPDQALTALETALIGATDLADKTFVTRKTAANITCAKVVAKHYADAAWKDRLTKIKPADKKSAVAASRTRMTKACTADKWSPTLRACLTAGGEYPVCAAKMVNDPWGFPAFGVIVPTGVPACDKYIAAIVKLAECPKAADLREAYLAMVSAAMSTMTDMPEESRAIIGEACEQGIPQIEEQAKGYGCSL